MKKLLLLFIAFVLMAGTSCQKKIDIAKEKEAIKAVIFGETKAWVDRDNKKFFDYYIQDEYQTRISARCDTFSIVHGWKNLSAMFEGVKWTGIENFKYSKEFVDIKVLGNAAWAIYKETQTYDKAGVPTKYDLLLTMVLEKKSEAWKISCFSIYVVPPPTNVQK